MAVSTVKNRWKSDGVTCVMVNMLGYGHATIMPYIMVIPYSNGIIMNLTIGIIMRFFLVIIAL